MRKQSGKSKLESDERKQMWLTGMKGVLTLILTYDKIQRDCCDMRFVC